MTFKCVKLWKKKIYKSLQNYSTSISFNYLIRNSIKINRKYLWKTLQISYLVTVALSKRSILFWTRTIGIFPHSSSTFNEKNQNLKLKLRKKLNWEKKERKLYWETQTNVHYFEHCFVWHRKKLSMWSDFATHLSSPSLDSSIRCMIDCRKCKNTSLST